MQERLIKVDICAIGAGSGGLAIAGRAARLGWSSILVEKGKMGGDCLNYGCVPSKALLAAGRMAAAGRRAAGFGITFGEPHVDGRAVHHHVHDVMAAIAPNDSVERMESFGARVVLGHARFTGPNEIEVGEQKIRARHFVIATGTRPAVPPIPGLSGIPFFTNETIFDSDAVPEHLLVIGGGSTGVEMAQAHRHLGSRVTLVEAASILPRDDPELVDVLRKMLVAEGVGLHEGFTVEGVEGRAGAVSLRARRNGQVATFQGSHLLVAAGRRANTDDLGLEKAGVAHGPKGIVVDRRLRTTNKRISAVGDVVGHHQFAHMAGAHAWVVLRNIMFRWPSKVDYRDVTWVTYTDPEIAHVGLSEAEARRHYGDVRVLRWPFSHNDRAAAERQTEGLVKVVTRSRGKVLGATIVGSQAGEQIVPWVLMVAKRMNVRDLATTTIPYPTFSYASKYAANSFLGPLIFGKTAKWLAGIARRFL